MQLVFNIGTRNRILGNINTANALYCVSVVYFLPFSMSGDVSDCQSRYATE